jgi:hypothetical protein
MKITTDTYRSFWKKANEKTSCYPDALSFASMKADGATYDLITELECGLINVALSSGYSPDRWKHLLDVRNDEDCRIYILIGSRTIWKST